MTFFRICDLCGNRIETGQPYVTVGGNPESRGGSAAAADHVFVGHYHARREGWPRDDEHPTCADRIETAIAVVHESFNPLQMERPTITGQKLAALRRKHRRPEDAR